MSDMKLQTLLAPESIALFGVTSRPELRGQLVASNLLSGGFSGELVLVDKAGGKLQGRPIYTDLQSYNGQVDLAIIASPGQAVFDALNQALSARAKAIVVMSAGFKGVDSPIIAQAAEMATLCRDRGSRLLGPASLGLINTHHKLHAMFTRHKPQPGVISVLSQSGAVCEVIIDWANASGVGLAKVVSLGHQLDLNETEILAALGEDDQTKVVVAYLESIESGNAFIKAAEAVAAIKPVICFKAGNSPAGAKVARQHLGVRPGMDIAYGAAFKRAGVIRAESLIAMLDHAIALSMQPLPRGERIALISNADGPSITACDSLEQASLQLATFDPESISALSAQLPGRNIENPVDLQGADEPSHYARVLELALQDKNVDAALVLLTPQVSTRPMEIAQALAKAAASGKPVLTSFVGGTEVSAAHEILLGSGLPDHPTQSRAVATLKALCEYAAWKRRPPRVLTRFLVNRRRVERIIRRCSRQQQRQVEEHASKDILRAYGFAVPTGYPALDPREAVEVAERIGYPVAMKISSPDIRHKSAVGGVRLNITTPEEVRDAFDLIMIRIRRLLPTANSDGVYIEKMCRPGRELLLGMHRDPQLGPMLMFGLGGVFVEVMKDVAFYLAPITADEAMQMLMSTRSFALLTGSSGQGAVDVAGIADALQRISQLVTDFPQIAELEISPLIVGEVGTDPVVAGAHVTLTEEGKPS
jgi:acyl-CoA synthetase (NDP forming)